MRALAEYIMRGRAQAALVAVLMGPILPAPVALVTLRGGSLAGLWVLLWAFAPMIVAIWSDAGFLPVAMLNLGTLVMIYIGALLLRAQINWATTATVITVMAVSFGVLFLGAFDREISAFLQAGMELQKANLERQGIAYDESLMQLPRNAVLMGIPIYGVAVNVVIALVVGRWWQAMLYNPGGLREEFKQLRLPPAMAGIWMAITVFCLLTDYYYWSQVTALPLVLVSIGLAHQFAGLQRMGRTWLAIYYLALLSLPFYLLMALLGGFDAWTNLRRRLLPAVPDNHNPPGPDE